MFDNTWGPEGYKMSTFWNPVFCIEMFPFCSAHWEHKYCMFDVFFFLQNLSHLSGVVNMLDSLMCVIDLCIFQGKLRKKLTMLTQQYAQWIKQQPLQVNYNTIRSAWDFFTDYDVWSNVAVMTVWQSESSVINLKC